MRNPSRTTHIIIICQRLRAALSMIPSDMVGSDGSTVLLYAFAMIITYWNTSQFGGMSDHSHSMSARNSAQTRVWKIDINQSIQVNQCHCNVIGMLDYDDYSFRTRRAVDDCGHARMEMKSTSTSDRNVCALRFVLKFWIFILYFGYRQLNISVGLRR